MVYENRLVVTEAPGLKDAILTELHDAPYSGHFGFRKTWELVKKDYWWPKLTASIRHWVSTCDRCQRDKASTQQPAGLLEPLQIPDLKFQSIGMDFIVQLPMTKTKRNAIFVIVDRLTKMVWLIPCTTTVTAEGVAELFYEHWWNHYGWPQEIVSDRDSKFTGTFWTELLKITGTKQSMSTPFHPESDGQTERINRILEDTLRHYVGAKQDDWDKLLPAVEFAINNSFQESTKTTPFELVYGQRLRTPLTVEAGGAEPTSYVSTSSPSANRIAEQVRNRVRRAKQCLLQARDRQKAYADRHRRDESYTKGQKVLLDVRNLSLRIRGSKKLLARWAGPFPILERIGKQAYQIDLKDTLPVHDVFHVSLLKPYKEGGRRQPPPPPVVIDGEPEDEVEQILAHRDMRFGPKSKRSKREYLVTFRGYGPEYNLWLPEVQCKNCPEKIQQCWEANPPTGVVGAKRPACPKARRAKRATGKSQ